MLFDMYAGDPKNMSDTLNFFARKSFFLFF